MGKSGAKTSFLKNNDGWQILDVDGMRIVSPNSLRELLKISNVSPKFPSAGFL